MRSRFLLAVVSVFALASSACVMAPLEQGYTDCGSFLDAEPCHPGQYCAESTLSRCELGCTSDENCARNQSCVKESGRQVGICLNKCPSCT
ncbi:hypothetical protein [Myxococcus hansupus]|uniref:hypothetical protein n=1 Tax=Pseudomyxococcus hansupus TaxID=1297742 RepID=UPI0002F72F0F|nr:hypothetical protein [Myxococcus hansupus]